MGDVQAVPVPDNSRDAGCYSGSVCVCIVWNCDSTAVEHATPTGPHRTRRRLPDHHATTLQARNANKSGQRHQNTPDAPACLSLAAVIVPSPSGKCMQPPMLWVASWPTAPYSRCYCYTQLSSCCFCSPINLPLHCLLDQPALRPHPRLTRPAPVAVAPTVLPARLDDSDGSWHTARAARDSSPRRGR
jgi:hypothetical protein